MNLSVVDWEWVSGLVAASYLMGSVPFGLLIAKARGVDLRHSGSGNIGATNVFRCVGKGWGVLALVLDALKGFVPAFCGPMVAFCQFGESVPPWLGVACGLAAVAGHNWPVWLGFKGGKGVATSAGMALGVAPGAGGVRAGGGGDAVGFAGVDAGMRGGDGGGVVAVPGRGEGVAGVGAGGDDGAGGVAAPREHRAVGERDGAENRRRQERGKEGLTWARSGTRW